MDPAGAHTLLDEIGQRYFDALLLTVALQGDLGERAIALMRAGMAAPCSTRELAEQIGTSVR